MTQIESAKQKIITDEVRLVARREGVDEKKLMRDIAAGRAVILKNSVSSKDPVGIGRNLSIKVNANIGTSPYCINSELELQKLEAASRCGADTVMDLSTGGDIPEVRRQVIARSRIPVGTVPIYEVITKNPDIALVREEDFLDSIRLHIENGVDFITVHCGVLKSHISLLESRIMGVVSRGGSFLVKWMLHHGRENPLFTRFDEICELAASRDVVLSLGDGLRPGCIADATDKAQLAELSTLGKLQRRAVKKGVQVMIEGPGHVPLQQIEKNIRIQKKRCHGAPFYVLGPLVTDISPGYDQITGAIGGALAAWYGADFLCYLTPKEHLGLPNLADVVDGVIASKIAAHAADIARGIPRAEEPDRNMAEARSRLDWNAMLNHALNPDKARAMRNEFLNDGAEICTMCGEFCSAKTNRDLKELYR